MKKLLPALIILTLCLLCFCSCSLFGNKACEHSEIIDAAVAPNCTETGLTEGKHCSLCGEVTLAQQTVPALGHTEVIDLAVPATCTEDGLTAGLHCSVCQTVIITQEIVPASHVYGEWENVSQPDCFFPGMDQRICSVCDEVETKDIETIAHSFNFDEESGLHTCEFCNSIIFQGSLYAVFNSEVNWFDAYATCKQIGGHLVTVSSEDEQMMINQIITTATEEMTMTDYYYWSGLIKDNNVWEWITNEELIYTNWASKEPDNSTAQWYMGFTTRMCGGNTHALVGQWEDLYHYTATYGFICEWDLDIVEDNHIFGEWKNVSEATCFVDGEEKRICEYCGLAETRVIDKIEHSFVLDEETQIESCEYCSAAFYNGHVYAIFTNKLSWFDAYSYCKNLGGELVAITSEEEQAFLESYMRSLSHTQESWIGAYTQTKGGEWHWTSGEAFEYSNWCSGEPNCTSSYEFFGHINFNSFGKWNDYNPLHYSLSFICEWN